jgi:hypothetical protein
MIERKFRADCAIVLTVICVVAPLTSYAGDEYPDELRRCSLIEDSSARLDCYDVLAGRRGPPETPVATASEALPQEAPPAAASVAQPRETPSESVLEPQLQKAPDDLGSEQLPKDAKEEAEKLSARASITGCQKDVFEKYLFFFDNGQVWKQATDKKLYFADCEFDVTITKDVFGYKMQRIGEKGTIRISRVR